MIGPGDPTLLLLLLPSYLCCGYACILKQVFLDHAFEVSESLVPGHAVSINTVARGHGVNSPAAAVR